MPTPQDIEEYLRQQGQNIQQSGQNVIQQNVDQPMARLQALQQMNGTPSGLQVVPQSPQAPMPSGGGGGMGGGPGAGTMDEMAAARQKQVDMYNAASAANASENQEPDLSGYSDVPKPQTFPNIKQRVQTAMKPQDINNTVADDDEDDENSHTGIIQTGTLGNY